MTRDKLIEELSKWEDNIEVVVSVNLQTIDEFSDNIEQMLMATILDVEEDNAQETCMLYCGDGSIIVAYAKDLNNPKRFNCENTS